VRRSDAACGAICTTAWVRPSPHSRSKSARSAGCSSNVQFAKQLSLSTKTVANYVSNIFGKLQVADRAQAMLRARDAGLGTIPR
jgi:hypothetical protein